MFNFKLPDIGEGIVEAEVVRWHVSEGDVIEENQVLVELMTDKASIEIPSPVAGRIHALGSAEGEVVRVGEVLVEIEDRVGARVSASPSRTVTAARPSRADSGTATVVAEELPSRTADVPSPPEGALETAPAATDGERAATSPRAVAVTEEHEEATRPPFMPPRPGRSVTPPPARPAERARAVPAVREFAKREGVDLAAVKGTGPGGRIMRRDIELYLASRGRPQEPTESLFSVPLEEETAPPAGEPEDWTREPLRGIRRATARKMRESKTKAAHYTYVEEVDLTEVESQRKALAHSLPEGELSPLAFIADAVVRVLPRYPRLNASVDEDRQEIILKGRIHLGVATATEAGLVVPVIHDAHLLTLRERAEAIRSLAIAARDGTLEPEKLRGSTFTISSLGKLGGLLATPIINYPETAILGVHAIHTLPRYVGDELRPRQVINLSLSLDHRVVDGLECAKMIQDVKEILEAAAFPSLDREERP